MIRQTIEQIAAANASPAAKATATTKRRDAWLFEEGAPVHLGEAESLLAQICATSVKRTMAVVSVEVCADQFPQPEAARAGLPVVPDIDDEGSLLDDHPVLARGGT